MRTLIVFIACVALTFMLNSASARAAAISPGSGRSCSISALPFDTLRAPAGGGAQIQEIRVSDDCSITKFPARTLRAGTAAFAAFLAAHPQSSPRHDPECWSELDYQDCCGIDLSTTRLGFPYAFNYAAGQVTAVYPLDWNAAAAIDGWYKISESTTPYTGPLPYGQANASGTAEFAWIAGSFWHRHTNNNFVDGFGACWGYPGEQGSTVPGGKWVWGVWQP